MKILICDPISTEGIEAFKKHQEFDVVILDRCHSEEELLPLLSDVVAMVVRSETKVTAKIIENAPNLKIVGRAGVGTDNVDKEAATKHGVIVVNTPGGNTIATAELTFSMLMSLARRIPQAHKSMKEGRWDRKKYKGIELLGKTLGVLGMGRIGGEVAKRAIAFGMTVVAFDPYLTMARAKDLGVELTDNLDDIYARADFITVHMPLTNETRDMLNKDAFAKMKKGVRLINCARGGIINEEDIVTAVQEGTVAGAALDVYTAEPLGEDSPLREVPEIIMTPHLGASTEEAQVNVGIEVADTIAAYLLEGAIQNSVNMPALDARTFTLVQPYLGLAEKLGKLAGQLAPKRNDRVVITFGGKAAEVPSDPITRCLLKGFLEGAGGNEVNLVNVRSLASGLGLVVEEIKSNENNDFREWLHVAVFSGDEKVSAGGTFFGARNEPRIVRLSSQPIEIVPEGVLFIYNNKDRPGMVGHIGNLLGKHDINIANMSLNRDVEGGQALTVLNLDSVPPAQLINELEADPDISNIRVANL